MPDSAPLQLRSAEVADLPAINAVIEAAIMKWQLPERVKRLALPSYRYTTSDLSHLEIIVAQTDAGIVGVAAWEPAEPSDLPSNTRGLLLHGLYVHPDSQHRGIGTRLLQAAEQQVLAQQYDGLLVKAQSEATAFFSRQGMVPLKGENPRRDYQNRLWKPASTMR